MRALKLSRFFSFGNKMKSSIFRERDFGVWYKDQIVCRSVQNYLFIGDQVETEQPQPNPWGPRFSRWNPKMLG